MRILECLSQCLEGLSSQEIPLGVYADVCWLDEFSQELHQHHTQVHEEFGHLKKKIISLFSHCGWGDAAGAASRVTIEGKTAVRTYLCVVGLKFGVGLVQLSKDRFPEK